MDVTLNLKQEMGAKAMVEGQGTGTDLGSEIDVQDWKIGEVTFLVVAKETGGTNPISVSVQVNDGDTGSTSNELATFNLDEVSASGLSVQKFSASEFDRYMKVQDISNSGDGTADVTVVALGGKRES